MDWAGVIQHFREQYPQYDDRQLINVLLSVKLNYAAAQLANQVYYG